MTMVRLKINGLFELKTNVVLNYVSIDMPWK